MPLPLFTNAQSHGDTRAVIDKKGSHSYAQLLSSSAAVAARLLEDKPDLGEARIAFLVRPGFEYLAIQWGIWRAGGIAVPVAATHAPTEIAHVLDDAQTAAVITSTEFEPRLKPLTEERSITQLTVGQATASEPRNLPELDSSRGAMILYTSGTTGKPKGAVLSHGNVQAQVEMLVEAWEWSENDHILNVLPLHHVHGIINAMTCAQWVGATCEFLAFDTEKVCQRLARGDLSLFMAVPTIYALLIAAWKDATPEEQRAMSEGCRRARLMVSGSAALPVSTLEEWRSITGQLLLERYGMTEIGMALSDPLRGERIPGHVGGPLPGVSVRLVDEADRPIENTGEPGEIQVRGPAVFSAYWRQAEVSKSAFCGAWFRTGDIAVVENGTYRILGRKSIDIIKTGGHKISALEVEEALLTHPGIGECSVVGVPDPVWGERVAVCVVLRENAALTVEGLRSWAEDKMAHYKIPTRLRAMEHLPRNSMGKVQKPYMRNLFEDHEPPP